MLYRPLLLIPVLFLAPTACSSDEDDGHATEADRLGVAAQCTQNADCNQKLEVPQTCLLGFKGGYCGVEDCKSNQDCPSGSACVMHDDSKNYCFRVCAEKLECNANRDADHEANCSSNVDFTDGKPEAGNKACVPPSG